MVLWVWTRTFNAFIKMPLKCEKWVRIPFGPPFKKMIIKVIHSRAQKLFKKAIGQANHFLITILIGLTEVAKGNTQKPVTMNVAWNPKDYRYSAIRSMRFALNSSLAWAVDNLDAYIQMCRRKPCLINNELLTKIDKADKSVYAKFQVLMDQYEGNEELNLYGALVALAIQWRNVTTHTTADNVLDEKYRKTLDSNAEWYLNNFRHLDVHIALKRFGCHRNPSLKEVASMIKAISRFVEGIDLLLLRDIDLEKYALAVIDYQYSLNKRDGKQDQRVLLPTMKTERRINKIKTILENNGFVVSVDDGLEINEEFVSKVLERS